MTATGTRADARKTTPTDAASVRRGHPGRTARIVRWVVLAIGALVFLFPFYYMVIGSLQTKPDTTPAGAFPNPANITFENYVEINERISLLSGLVNSGIFTGGVILCTVVFGVLAGYALSVLHWRGRGVDLLDRPAGADRAVPAADDPALRADRAGLRAGRHAPRHDPAVRHQLGSGAHLPAVLHAGAARAVRRGAHRRRERIAGAVERRSAARAARSADRGASHLHRPVERVPLALPDHERPGVAAAGRVARELHHDCRPPRRPTRSGRSWRVPWCSPSPRWCCSSSSSATSTAPTSARA